ncbi:MarR family winged helix-turn-helix transcriptional regulator [Paraurantiacibacter namhicola]|uniref:MarR family protein n=1 Tax=Paraurantiacibacter namhicola TaxID=645517 RepID=A0A1C7DAG3_9SPHN|nr:MarR family transcriptional regulator [Paraurantiacibacter namhicola]ANU08425.1 MarR family protein [Paraurantiacibacter namhicola]
MSDAKTRLPLPPLMDRISFLTHRLNALMARACNPYFQVWGVDLIMSRMMVVLLEHGSLPAGEIVRIMALPQSTISHQIKRLEKLGYIQREQGKDDSRVRVASLTDRGREVAEEANLLSRQVVGVLLDSIGEDDMETVRAALKRADTALQAFRFKQD